MLIHANFSNACLIRYRTIRLGTIRCRTIRPGTIRAGTIRPGTIRAGTIRCRTKSDRQQKYSAIAKTSIIPAHPHTHTRAYIGINLYMHRLVNLYMHRLVDCLSGQIFYLLYI